MSGKVVLVTGAARGIGAAAARELHGRGAQVALVGLEPERLAALAGELGDRVRGSKPTSPTGRRSTPRSRAPSSASAASTW